MIHKVGIEYTNDLHTIALAFRLFRQQRLPISADVFNRFFDKEGELRTSLTIDVQGLLSFYEATYLGTPNEEILEKAATFAKWHLGLMCTHLEPNMRTIVSRALITPRFKRMERLEAREFISFYDKQENKREDLLQFAKLDFVFVQSIHLEELRILSIWNKNIGLAKDLPFVRDRLVELHFWMVGVFFEPCYSYARKTSTKVLVLTSILDDIYDQYGTLKDLQLLTGIINRWKVDERVDQLPIYLQKFIIVFYKTFEEFKDELAINQSTYRVQYLKKEHEQTANHLATIVHNYMKEYNCTEEETCQKLIEMVENEWKTLNQELLLLTNLPLTLVRPIINLTRVMEIFYKEKDTFTNPFDTMKHNISLVMIEPLFPKGSIPK
ncbi:hypothetical protein HPP92_023788 [Vanilla planifolia]|uniref:Uncharacterized protein n=1 Tax=Vanilla planifolia TaxID=51239 RepID=A0A835UCP1_VANPL|nr:hypothetical protein HPP92_023788 [Vanilla planifolia]